MLGECLAMNTHKFGILNLFLFCHLCLDFPWKQYHPRGIFNFLQLYPVKSLSHTFVNLHNVFNIYEPTADLRVCIKSHSGCNIEKEPLKNQITSFKGKNQIR